MQFKDRQETLEKIEAFKIASGDIAKLAEVAIQRISDFKSDRRVEAKRAQKIVDAVQKIHTVLRELDPVKIDVRDPQNVLRALAELNKVKTEQLAAETAEFVKAAEKGLSQVLSTK
jgi:phosphoribosylanthranilate isomerase